MNDFVGFAFTFTIWLAYCKFLKYMLTWEPKDHDVTEHWETLLT